MRITIEYPQIMKMTMASQMEISNPVSLNEVKRQVFDEFWVFFLRHYPYMKKHGSAESIVLTDKDIEINSDDLLQERLAQSKCFQAVFNTNGHP
ncbi:MAG TPA: hypothetical protein VLE89_07090 [Chlamydiales bacterium]|nr:hypothetical protein [Chlamydiales bacterium]